MLDDEILRGIINMLMRIDANVERLIEAFSEEDDDDEEPET